jgi:hypothetical protein
MLDSIITKLSIIHAEQQLVPREKLETMHHDACRLLANMQSLYASPTGEVMRTILTPIFMDCQSLVKTLADLRENE